jgi:hypothetical protein
MEIDVIYKKRKQQKLLTNPVAFNKLQTEVLAYLIFRPKSSIKMIFEFGFNRYDFEPRFSIFQLIPYSQICKIFLCFCLAATTTEMLVSTSSSITFNLTM